MSELRDSLGNAFVVWFQGNHAACQYCLDLWDIAQVWDDLIDGDHVEGDEINKVMVKATSSLHTNPFFVQYASSLIPVQVSTFLQWRDATTIELDPERTEDDLAKCYMLRAGLYSLFAFVAFLVGGDEWAKQVGPQIRRHYGEKFSEYRQEMQNA